MFVFYPFAGGLDNVEYYDIKINEWKMVSPMPWKGVTVKCAAVGSIVYVLAGFQGVGRLGHILEYNTETDKWFANSKVRAFPVTSCLICVVDTCGANEETLETWKMSGLQDSLETQKYGHQWFVPRAWLQSFNLVGCFLAFWFFLEGSFK